MDYRAYNERMIGDTTHQRDLYRPLVPWFRDAPGPIWDLGAGRGTMLDLLRGAGHATLGVEIDPAMCAYLDILGLPFVARDAVAFVEDPPPKVAPGGIFCAHLIEHLARPDLYRFLTGCARQIAPGGTAVFLTPNIGNLWVLRDTFYKDVTHTAPVHPEALAFLLEAAGLGIVHVGTLSPLGDERRLEAVGDAAHDRNIAKLNAILFGDLDTIVVARKASA